MSEYDDRQFARSPAKLEATLASELGEVVRGTVRDVSVAGLYVACTERLPVGTICEITVDILEGDDDGPIQATGRVAHVTHDGMGIEITDLDLAHYEELRRLTGHAESDEG